MRVVTMVSLGASAVLGVAALVVAKTWLPSNKAPSQGASAAASRGSPVVVAAGSLAYGTKLEAKDLRVVQFPAEGAPEGAYATVEAALAADKGAPVALVPIAAREAILPAKLSGPGARLSVAAMIADGMRAYSIRVTDVSGVGGNALPGDRVDVVLTRDLSPTQDNKNLVADVVIQNVRVLGVDLNADPTSTKTAVPATATLEVNVADAQKLSVAAQLGDLSLALRKSGETTLEQSRLIRSADLRGVGSAPLPVALKGARPVARAAVAVPAPPAPPRRPPMVIVNGDKRDAVDVPVEGRTGA